MRPLPARAAFTAICLVGSASAFAQTPDAICVELRAIVAAAGEEPPFASMPWEPHSLRLGFDNCSVLDMSIEGDSADFVCITDYPDSLRRWEQLSADVLRCLPGAERYDDPGWTPPTPPDRWAHIRAGRVQIHIHEAGYANLPQRYVALHIGAERAQ